MQTQVTDPEMEATTPSYTTWKWQTKCLNRASLTPQPEFLTITP